MGDRHLECDEWNIGAGDDLTLWNGVECSIEGGGSRQKPASASGCNSRLYRFAYAWCYPSFQFGGDMWDVGAELYNGMQIVTERP